VEHHVEEEQGELFKAANQELGPAELDALGAQMETLFDEEMEGEPSDSVPEQTAQAAPLK